MCTLVDLAPKRGSIPHPDPATSARLLADVLERVRGFVELTTATFK